MSEKQSDSFFKIIESNIRQQSKARGITLAELSHHIEMTEAGFYKMLASESIKLKTLKRIADVLEQPIEYFLFEQNEPVKKRAKYAVEEDIYAQLAEPATVYQKENEILQKQISLLESQLKDKERIIELLSKQPGKH